MQAHGPDFGHVQAVLGLGPQACFEGSWRMRSAVHGTLTRRLLGGYKELFKSLPCVVGLATTLLTKPLIVHAESFEQKGPKPQTRGCKLALRPTCSST